MPRSFLVKKNAKQAASGLRKLQHGIATTAYNPAEGAGTAAYPEMSLTAPINIPHPVIHKPAPLQAIPNPTTASFWRPHHQPSHPQHHISSHYNKGSLYDSKNSIYNSSNHNQEIHQTHRFGNHQQQPQHPNLMYARAPLPVSPFEADTFPHIHKGYSPPPPFSQPLHAHLPQQSLQRLLTPTPAATPLIASDENRLLSPTHPHYPHHAHHNHHHHHPHHNQQQQLPPSAALTVAAAKPEKEVKRRKGAKSGEESTKYHCPDCGKEYSTFGGLSKHRQLHCDAQNKKTFNCKYCDKEYMSLGALKMHIRTHTLPCKCEFCGKAFSRPWLLQGHIRTHTGEKPFRCQHCQRAFADRSNLRAHLQTHSEVKKYSCKSCGKTFSRMSLLSKHEESGCMSSNSD